jgi:hypothetical protein
VDFADLVLASVCARILTSIGRGTGPRRITAFRHAGPALFVVLCVAAPAVAQDRDTTVSQAVESIEVEGTPLSGGELDAEWAANNSQVATSQEIAALGEVGLAQFLNASMRGIHLNEAQNNPLQPDLQYRGYTASPLLGLAQGLAVYQDGMRLNEPFGDVVNWDLIPKTRSTRSSCCPAPTRCSA